MTDEWMVTGIDAQGNRKRFIVHDHLGITSVASRAESLQVNAWGEGAQIVSIVNQEEQ